MRNSNGHLRANSGREPREKVTILRKKFSPPMEVAARRDGGVVAMASAGSFEAPRAVEHNPCLLLLCSKRRSRPPKDSLHPGLPASDSSSSEAGVLFLPP